MTLGVRGLAFDAEGRALLVRHTYISGWHLPGGGIERGETALDALTREMAEEAGLKIEAAPLLLGVYSNHRYFANDHVIVYRIERFSACPTDSEGEIAECGFFPPSALPDGATPATRRRIEEALSNAPPSPYW